MTKCDGNTRDYDESRALIVDGGGRRYQCWVYGLNEALTAARRWQTRNKLESVTAFIFNPNGFIIKTPKDWDTVTPEQVRAEKIEVETFSINGKDITIDED